MSQLLRHGAENKGVEIDAGGWVLVADMLARKEFTKKACTLETIQHVVENNEKKRFELSKDLLKVRASQGHSIASVKSADLLQKIENPFTYNKVVHGTMLEPLQIILKSGLNKMGRNHVHFAIGLPDNEAVKSGMRGNSEVIVEVNMAKAMYGINKIPFYLS